MTTTEEKTEKRVGATRLGSYEIVRKLARGGMAEIYLAKAVGLEGFEKLVVLKKILPHFAANPKFVKLFLDEAKLAAGFDHPHIAHVYDMGMVDGNYFFTMEFVHGQDVRALLRRTDQSRRQLPIELAVQIARNVASALHYAHERRRPDGTLLDVVHRDVSPSNMIVSYDGTVKLLDFGVAKAASSSVRTRTGTLKGKIGYMSPEQARGATIDRRSDIFSLGIVLWEMVATRRLYKADNDLATIQLIVNTQPPPPSVVRPDCPPELERIVLRALAQDPARRYQTAQELQLDLEELARENKLNQSSVALSAYMNHLFSAEIHAWRDAQAHGVTLFEHVVAAQGSVVSGLTTPVSLSDGSIEDEPEEDDPNDLPSVARDAATTAAGHQPWTAPAPSIPPPVIATYPLLSSTTSSLPAYSQPRVALPGRNKRPVWIAAGVVAAAAIAIAVVAGGDDTTARGPAPIVVTPPEPTREPAVAPVPAPAPVAEPAPAAAPTPVAPDVAENDEPVRPTRTKKPTRSKSDKPTPEKPEKRNVDKQPEPPTKPAKPAKPAKPPRPKPFDPNDPLPPG